MLAIVPRFTLCRASEDLPVQVGTARKAVKPHQDEHISIDSKASVTSQPSRTVRAFGPGFGPGFVRGATGSSAVPILRLSFMVAALVQMLAYAVAVLYAVLVGATDLVIPAKTAFLGIVSVLIMKPYDDFTIAWKNRRYDPSGAADALLYFGVVLLGATIAILYDLLFILHPLSSIDLTTETIGVRTFVTAGVAILLWFIYGQFRPILDLPFKKLRIWTERRRLVAVGKPI